MVNPKYTKYISTLKNTDKTYQHYQNNTFNYGGKIKKNGTYNTNNGDAYNDIDPYLTNKRVALDIGARWGEWTRMLIPQFEHVYCFEPHEARHKYIPENCDMSKIALFGCCLGEKEEDVTMYGGCIYEDKAHVKDHIEKPKKLSVKKSLRLDDLEIDNVDFIKIDVEGFELPVIKGGINTIKKCKPIICLEQNGSEKKWRNAKKNEAMEFLKSIGMKVEKQLNDQDYLLVWE